MLTPEKKGQTLDEKGQTLDERGKACPIPVIETKRTLEAAAPGAQLRVIVDNATAVANLAKFAEQRGHGFAETAQHPGEFHVLLTKRAASTTDQPDVETLAEPTGRPRKAAKVVAIASATMGVGDDRLGATLLRGFIYALTEQDDWPETMLFYNGGAHLTVEGSESLDDLRRLETGGVQILTCGTCLNHYGLSEKLAVGGVTNMYSIVELLTSADVVIRP